MPQLGTLYDYLEASGVLEHGTPDAIRDAKHEYWKLRRKEWRKQQRTECKSYTVFLTVAEQRLISNAISGSKKNITGFIRRSALNAANQKEAVNKVRIGKIREAFFNFYSNIEAITPDKIILKTIEHLEQTVLNLLK